MESITYPQKTSRRLWTTTSILKRSAITSIEFESPIWFRVQWIDDSNVNLVFKTHEHAAEALRALSISGGPSDNEIKEFSQEYVSSIVQERETKPYAASISFHKYQKELQKQSEEKDLFEDKKPKEEVQENGMDEDDSSVVLYIRQSFQSDRKVKTSSRIRGTICFMENQTERRDRVSQDSSVTVGAVEGMPEKRKKSTTYLSTSSNRSRVVVRKRTICLLGDCESSLSGERKKRR
ncbi:hypothetical protein CJJ09_000032 [Candidozyma auris]|nr:hypothetical protein CJJ09_000032 [[Candida] auris]